ncbi:MAG: magnesium and cobalt transport protein CorA, partial [Campylobacteraceae bacterium]|nr:magnesium and cobalt transport protein CorA [Campylobacteraceae bacterium]
ILFTLRYRELKSFSEMHKRLLKTTLKLNDGYDIFMQIFELRVEADADLIEYAAKEINKLRKDIFSSSQTVSDDEVLERISTIQEFNLKVRESISDKRRITIGLLKSDKMSQKHKEDLRIMVKDIGSLIEYTTINLNALDNIQNLFIGQINIDQNKVIKLFTVVNVVLMPPTLIASIYGMNFKIIPELQWEYGYFYSLILMVVSSLAPLWYFKKKNWF